MKRSQLNTARLVLVIGILGLILWNISWVHYQLAASQDSIGAYEDFVKAFPQSDYAITAMKRIEVLRPAPAPPGGVAAGETPLSAAAKIVTSSSETPKAQPDPAVRENLAWQTAAASHDIEKIRAYVHAYPYGKHAAEAKGKITELADAQWILVAVSSSEAEMESFIKSYPGSAHVREAQTHLDKVREDRTRSLQEESEWKTAEASNDVKPLRGYLRSYPNGKYAAVAKAAIVAIADAEWATIADSKSEKTLADFVKVYPESTQVSEAEARIQKLYDDFDWVMNEGTLIAFRRYLQRNPNDPRRAIIEKKMIDLEVADIAALPHGTLPAAQPMRVNAYSSFSDICVENGTGYELTVRYSGPDSKKLIIPVGQSSSVHLAAGTYTVAASVAAAFVQNYVGTSTFQGGEYASQFYIRSSFALPPPAAVSGFRTACSR